MPYFRCLAACIISLLLLVPLGAHASSILENEIAELAKAAKDAALAAAAASKAAAIAADAAQKAAAAAEAAVKAGQAKPGAKEPNPIAAQPVPTQASKEFVQPDKQEDASWLYVSALPLDKKASINDGKEPPLRFFRAAESKEISMDIIDKFDKVTYGSHTIEFKVGSLDTLGLTAYEPSRELWTTGKELKIAYVVSGPCLQPAPDFAAFTETERSTVIERQIRKIGQSLLSGDKVVPNAADNSYCMYVDAYTLGNVRANLKVDVKGAGTDEKKSKSAVIVTGPEEHWFISADAIVKSTNQLTYDTATKSVTEKKKAGQFYLGVNRLMGDIMTDYGMGSLKNLAVKFMVSANNKPLDSVGLGLGYDLKSNIIGSSKPTSFMLFVGYFHQKGQGSGAGDANSWRAGLSYNFVDVAPAK
jgi:hypothetical protein